MKKKIIEQNDKLFEKIYGDGNYDHILNFDGTVNSQKYNEEQVNTKNTLIGVFIGVIIFVPLILNAIWG